MVSIFIFLASKIWEKNLGAGGENLGDFYNVLNDTVVAAKHIFLGGGI